MKNYEWSLDALYKGYDDPIFLEDIEKLKNWKCTLSDVCQKLQKETKEIKLHEGLALLEKIREYTYRLKMYTQLRLSVDSNDEQNNVWSYTVNNLIADISYYESMVWNILLDIEDLESLIETDAKARDYRFLLHEKIQKRKYDLNEQQEQILSMLYPTGIKAFSDMYYALTGNAKANFRGEVLPLTKVKNMCHDTCKEVRKDAFLAELKAYEAIAESLSFAISAIKSQQLKEARLRGYKDPLEKMLIESRMRKNTLDVMMKSIEAYLPMFRTYLKKKASLLGYAQGLPWYEIYATLGECGFHFSIEECNAYILKHFKPVSEHLYQMVKRAFEEDWIDYPTRKGKQPGAFCENLGWIKESRMITNYNYTLSDIVTVAHELGHAFHGMMIEDQPILNREYCMPLAETASTFNENIIYNALAADMNAKDRLLVLDTQLSALCQNILDIYARFQFEKAVFEHVEKGFLNASQLCELMKEALLKSFGDGLDPKYLHPYRWITKVHYYLPDIAYYNFPYTFGALFSRGLYAKYQAEGSTFIPKYEALLQATTTNTVEDVARIAGIDITTDTFWKQSLQSIVDQMQEFLKLIEKE